MHTKTADHNRMSVDGHVTNGWTVVTVTGEMDDYTSPMIRTTVGQLLDADHRHFILDLCPAVFLDSAGLGMIVAITKHIRAHGGSLRIACTDERLLKVFKLGGLRRAYTFHASVAEATREIPRHDG